ncbi:uncharacterized protein V6R79_016817 [Siganus canaliculatus]
MPLSSRRTTCSQSAAPLCRMPQRKLLQLSALLLLLPWFDGLVLGEISTDFSQCLHFFYKKTPPKGISAEGYQPICQRYKNQYRFASLYHRQHRAPLYSAYILSKALNKRPTAEWMYEPQLAFPLAGPEMKPFRKRVAQNVTNSQAVPADYRYSDYTKGHLNPSMHQMTKDSQKATFTLTNIVPQRAGSNSGPWSVLETEVLNKFQSFCRGSMYVITGGIPYESGPHWMNNRVSVPEYMWSAYCCPSFDASLPESERPFFPSYAAVGRNDPNSGEEIVPVDMRKKPSVRGFDVRRMSLQTLEGILTQRLGGSIQLFHQQCMKQSVEGPYY